MMRRVSIIIILSLLATVHAVLFFLPTSLYETYFNIIRPVTYIIILIFAYLTLGRTLKIFSGKKTLVLAAVLGVIIYLAINFIVGMFMGFGHNSMSLAPLGIIKNFWAYIVIIIFRENIRSLIVTHVRDKYKRFILPVIVIVFTFMSLDSLRGVVAFDLYQQVDWFFVTLLPILAMNIWFTYAAMNGGLVGNLIFAIGYNALIYFSPILPDIPHILDAIVLYCIVFLMFIVYDSIEWMAQRQDGVKVEYKDRRRWGWTLVPAGFLTVCIMFGIGVFPIMPVAVASNSMSKEFSRGDLIYVEKTSPDELEVGNVVQYNKGNISIVHRIVDIREDSVLGRYFIFKGDENLLTDMYPVYDNQIVGRVVAKTPFLGFPALLFQGLKGTI